MLSWGSVLQMKAVCMGKLLPPGQGTAMATAPAGPGAMGSPGCQGLSRHPQPEMAAGCDWEGPGSWCWGRAGQKAHPQGWGQLQAQPDRATGTDHARTSAHRWKPRARCSTGTAELKTSIPPGQTGAEGPRLSLNRAPGPMGVGRPWLRLVRAWWYPWGLALLVWG